LCTTCRACGEKTYKKGGTVTLLRDKTRLEDVEKDAPSSRTKEKKLKVLGLLEKEG